MVNYTNDIIAGAYFLIASGCGSAALDSMLNARDYSKQTVSAIDIKLKLGAPDEKAFYSKLFGTVEGGFAAYLFALGLKKMNKREEK